MFIRRQLLDTEDSREADYQPSKLVQAPAASGPHGDQWRAPGAQRAGLVAWRLSA
jgi:hypothetical protein